MHVLPTLCFHEMKHFHNDIICATVIFFLCHRTKSIYVFYMLLSVDNYMRDQVIFFMTLSSCYDAVSHATFTTVVDVEMHRVN